MQINAAGLALIKEFEGCRLESYQDQIGRWTIGYGDAIGIIEGMKITQEEADALLVKRLQEFEDGVFNSIAKQATGNLTGNQFSAMVCLAYNIGLGNFLKSTLLHCYNTLHVEDAAEEFLKWNKAGGVVREGLVRRREAEKALFLA